MDERNFNLFMGTRIFMALIPLLLGWPMLSFCLCAQTASVVMISRGPVYGVVGEAVTAAAVALCCGLCGYGYAYGGFLAISIVLASSFSAFCVITKKTFSFGLFCGAVSYGVGNLLMLRYMAGEEGLSVADYMSEGFTDSIRLSMEAASLAADGVAELLDKAEEVIRLCAPAVIVVEALIAGYVFMWMLSKSLRGSILDNAHSFAGIRLGLPGLAFGAAMLAAAFIPDRRACIIGINGTLIFMFLAFSNGLSLADWLMRKKVRRTLHRILLHCALLFAGMLAAVAVPFANIFLLYAVVGVADSIFSFRKRVNIGNEKQ